MSSDYWRNWQLRRSSRRRFVGGSATAGAGLAGLALVGCGDDDDDDPTATATATGSATGTGTAATSTGTSAAQPKTGGTLRVHMGGSPRSLDPHFDTFPFNTAITDNTNERLLKWAPDFSEIQTEMAAALPEQPDELTFTFKLTPGIKFANVDPVNGRDFTSEDVKYSLERQMTDEAGKFQHAYFFLRRIASIETPDATTVTVKTVAPYAPFLSYIASPWTVMIAREAVEKFGDLTQNAVGTGPFIFKEWQKDVKIDLVKNPDYWQKGLPYLDGISHIIAIDPDTSATLYIEKQVDSIVVGQSQLQRVLDDRKDNSNYEIVPSQFWRQMRMMPTTAEKPYVAPYDDIKVREAIVRAVNAKQVLELVHNGDGVLTNGPILPIYPLWTLKEEIATFDLKKATDLMAAAGNPTVSAPMIWATGSPVSDQVGEVLKQQLAEIGVEVELTPMELAAYYNLTYAYNYTFSHHVPLNNPDPDENLSSYFGRNSTFYKHHNEDIFAKIDEQALELDIEARQEIVQEAQRMIVNDFPVKFMYTTNNHLFTDEKVQGWFYPTDLYDGRKAEAWLNA